ncbi:LPD29 domain-containing protein [Streptomyces sp. NPDC002586]
MRLHTDTVVRTIPGYLALRLAPGTLVRYTGTVTKAHAEGTVHPCSCTRCFIGALLGEPATRYEVRTAGHTITHVRHTSVTPLVGEEERNYGSICLSTKATAAALRQRLRAAFPGVKFSVRCGRDKTRTEITVSWTGGPRGTAVATVTAPFLARYGNSKERRPARISVTLGGRVHSGEPYASAIHLNHTPAGR